MPSRSFYRPKDFRHLKAVLACMGEDVDGDWDVPVIPSVDVLSMYVGLDKSIFYWIVRNKSKLYRTHYLEKKSGFRRIDAPRLYLKVIQHWVLDNILVNSIPHYCAHGFVKGGSPVSNAEKHLGNSHIINVDISNFFGSITRERIRNVFEYLDYQGEVASLLESLCSFNGRLPQGAPTSPSLANLALYNFDERLCDLLPEDVTYTRYADDITLSSKNFLDTSLIDRIGDELAVEGLSLNASKTKVLGPGDRLEVTGYVINEHVQRPRWWRNQMRSVFHKALTEEDYRLQNGNKINGYIAAVLGCGANKDSSLYKLAVHTKRQMRPRNSELD